ncbi:MAG: exopolysaccharide biosynthesis polyprenyl glycosylphosphotransferase [Muribaculaceae bacterium]|nr:exopolysaccharide biosynthesis polyprenyl glycosylphosphotransferase [Muribaculaceae bacterium]
MQKALKRIFDFVIALLAIIALAPLWIVIAIWIAATSPGGVFFRQRRTGYMGEEFDLLKFRSMYINHEADTKQASENDPRITPIGRFLRRSSLDELPQLYNVLRGDMSIIGPRPHMVAHTDYYTPRVKNYMRRHEMRPGLTGYAQVSGFRGATPTVDDMRRRVEADIYYVDHYSLWLDLKIFFLTIWKMLTLKL